MVLYVHISYYFKCSCFKTDQNNDLNMFGRINQLLLLQFLKITSYYVKEKKKETRKTSLDNQGSTAQRCTLVCPKIQSFSRNLIKVHYRYTV